MNKESRSLRFSYCMEGPWSLRIVLQRRHRIEKKTLVLCKHHQEAIGGI